MLSAAQEDHDGEHFGRDEELDEDEEAQRDAAGPGLVPLADQDLVQGDQDEGEQHQGCRHQVGELQAGEDEG